MWKLGVLFVFVALEMAVAQNITLTCYFGDYGIGDLYMCSLQRITVLNPSVNVVINGTHAGNKTDADVDLVEIYNSNTPFIIRQLFTTFPNLRVLNIYDSKVETINVPVEAQLLQLVLTGNNISKIQSVSLRNQTQLRYLLVTNSGVKHIDEDAFQDLHEIEQFSLMNNEIENLTARTLAPFRKAVRLNFAWNSLTTIDEDIFARSPNLEGLYLEHNQIDKIHPRTFDNLRNLTYVGLDGNRCVRQDFSIGNDQDWDILHKSLQTCFDNHGTAPVVRNITMQFSGPLTIYDDAGNNIIKF